MKNYLCAKASAVIVLWLIGAGAVTAQETAAAGVAAPYAGATVSDFKGKVGIQLPGQGLLPPTRGEVLPPESVVNTEDGRILLRLSDGSDVLVRPNSRLIVKEPETSGWHYLQLILGRIHSQIQHRLGGTPSFQMGTPSAVISVRGTIFDVEVDSHGHTELDVHEGVVELASSEGHGNSVMVTAGFSSRVGMDSAPELPRPTHDLRPQLDRRSRRDHDSGGRDDAIRRLEASMRDSRDSRDGDSGGTSGGGGGSDDGGSGSTSGSSSGSSGSGSDGGSGSSGGSSGSDDGDRHRSGGGKPPGII